MLFDHPHRLARQGFELASRQVFLTQLDVVHAAARGFGDFSEQTFAADRFRAAELGTVADVVEKQARIQPLVFGRFFFWQFCSGNPSSGSPRDWSSRSPAQPRSP